MNPDPVLNELWEIKEGLAAESNHDLRCLFNRLVEFQKEQGTPLTNRTNQRMKVAESG